MPAKPPARSGRHESSVLDSAAAAALALRASKPVSRPSKRPRIGVARGARDPADVPHFVHPDEGSVDAFERHALGPLLWHRPDDDELPDIPSEFRNERHYVESFEPVLLEETREETRNAWLESIGEGREYRLTLRALRATGASGWRVATFHCADRKDCEVIKSLCPDHSVAVVAVESVCSTRDPWPRTKDGCRLPLACAGFVEKTLPREGLVEFRFFVSPEADAAVDPSAPGWKPWHQAVRDRERCVLEAFEGVRRRVRRPRGAPRRRTLFRRRSRPAAIFFRLLLRRRARRRTNGTDGTNRSSRGRWRLRACHKARRVACGSSRPPES